MQVSIGILGGGQLGWLMGTDPETQGQPLLFLDPQEEASCRMLPGSLHHGDFRQAKDVFEFGQNVDVLGIEIEDVNTEALDALTLLGKKVIPSAHHVRQFQDKGWQKSYIKSLGLPTLPFVILENGRQKAKLAFPYFLKKRHGGYDGYGVQKIETTEDVSHGFKEPCVAEVGLCAHREFAITIARDASGNIATFPVVEMTIHPDAFRAETVICPAILSKERTEVMAQMAQTIAQRLDFIGILSVEFFEDAQGQLWINEMAPRVHNSAHHSSDTCNISQFGQYVRILKGLPVIPVTLLRAGLMFNLVGAPDASGAPDEAILKALKTIPGTKVYWYGKKEVRPFRKMGHINLTAKHNEDLKSAVKDVRNIGLFIRGINSVSL
jgi:5-(carboxyamino)imidazole ribonucleotide synthase